MKIMVSKWWFALSALALPVAMVSAAQGASAGGTPKIVTAYATQLAAMCQTNRGAAPAPVAPDRVDLNGDGLVDWVFDGGRVACAASNPMIQQYGALLTVFVATPDGDASPVFQQAVHAARLERIAGKTRLVVTVGGRDCGEASDAARCDRPLSWAVRDKRFELAPLAPTKTASAVATPAARQPQ